MLYYVFIGEFRGTVCILHQCSIALCACQNWWVAEIDTTPSFMQGKICNVKADISLVNVVLFLIIVLLNIENHEILRSLKRCVRASPIK